MGGCQNYGMIISFFFFFLGGGGVGGGVPNIIRRRIFRVPQKATRILTTTQIGGLRQQGTPRQIPKS